MLGEQGHEISWFHYPDKLKTYFDPKVSSSRMHDSNLIAIKKKSKMKEK
jgi:hypothetical protein